MLEIWRLGSLCGNVTTEFNHLHLDTISLLRSQATNNTLREERERERPQSQKKANTQGHNLFSRLDNGLCVQKKNLWLYYEAVKQLPFFRAGFFSFCEMGLWPLTTFFLLWPSWSCKKVFSSLLELQSTVFSTLSTILWPWLAASLFAKFFLANILHPRLCEIAATSYF